MELNCNPECNPWLSGRVRCQVEAALRLPGDRQPLPTGCDWAACTAARVPPWPICSGCCSLTKAAVVS